MRGAATRTAAWLKAKASMSLGKSGCLGGPTLGEFVLARTDRGVRAGHEQAGPIRVVLDVVGESVHHGHRPPGRVRPRVATAR